MKIFAQQLRKKFTETEIYLWRILRNRKFQGFKFRRQHPIENYIVDFICHSKKLIIELDGSQHLENVLYDKERMIYLKGLGYKVLRFWNNTVFKETSFILEVIYHNLQRTLTRPPDTLSRKRERGFNLIGYPNVKNAYSDKSPTFTQTDV
jgi:very-short-patch-repair endonuclease